MTTFLEPDDGELYEQCGHYGEQQQPRREGVVGLGHGGQKEDPDEARCDQQIDDAPFPSGFEAYPCRQQIGCDAGYIPRHGRKHDASREFGCEDTLQVYTQQDKAQREEAQRRKELKKTITDHITWCNNERIQAKLNYLSPVEFRLKNYQQTVAF